MGTSIFYVESLRVGGGRAKFYVVLRERFWTGKFYVKRTGEILSVSTWGEEGNQNRVFDSTKKTDAPLITSQLRMFSWIHFWWSCFAEIKIIINFDFLRRFGGAPKGNLMKFSCLLNISCCFHAVINLMCRTLSKFYLSKYRKNDSPSIT